MEFTTFLWFAFGAFVTLATFSFLYKDNPFYKFAEHLVVGVSAGYFAIILWHQGLVDKLISRLEDGSWYLLWIDSTYPWYLIPALLGILMWTRFSKKYQWVSRWPMALYIGISAGLAVPLEMSNRVNKQLFATMQDIDWTNFFGVGGFNLIDINSGLSQLLIFVGVISALIYFFFSKSHTGVFGRVATLGIWVLMVGFGASFGFTVMARISLFINRIQSMDNDFVQLAFDSSNPNWHVGFQLVFWLIVLSLLAYTISEIVRYLRHKDSNITPPETT
jgi:hypothetical protein